MPNITLLWATVADTENSVKNTACSLQKHKILPLYVMCHVVSRSLTVWRHPQVPEEMLWSSEFVAIPLCWHSRLFRLPANLNIGSLAPGCSNKIAAWLGRAGLCAQRVWSVLWNSWVREKQFWFRVLCLFDPFIYPHRLFPVTFYFDSGHIQKWCSLKHRSADWAAVFHELGVRRGCFVVRTWFHGAQRKQKATDDGFRQIADPDSHSGILYPMHNMAQCHGSKVKKLNNHELSRLPFPYCCRCVYTENNGGGRG